MLKKLSFLKKPVGIISLLFVITLGVSVYYFVQYHKAIKNPAEEAKIKTDAALDQVSKLMFIGDRTGAVLATITDKNKLAGQDFFKNAQNGDELILLPAMSKAIIYRPSAGKIVDVGPFNPNAATQTQSGNQTSTKPVQKSSTATSSVKSK